jgi:hypothetical protein
MTSLDQELVQQAIVTPIPLKDLLTEVQREARKRREVYPNWVNNRKLSARSAAHRIAVMEQIAVMLGRQIAEQESLQPAQMPLFTSTPTNNA